MTNNFTFWINGAPVISFLGNWDFSVWVNAAPVLTRDESGPYAPLIGRGVASTLGTAAVGELRGMTVRGYGATEGVAVIAALGNLAGTGIGATTGLAAIVGLGNLAGTGIGATEGTGTVTGGGIPPVIVVLHRVASPKQPLLRQANFATERWWSRRISPQSERQRVLS